MTKAVRLKVYAKYKGRCAYCGSEITLNEMQIDHIKPATDLRYYKEWIRNSKDKNYRLSEEQCLENAECIKIRIEHEFGSIENVDNIDNLLPTCRDCNLYKSCYNLEYFRCFMKKLHLRMKYKSAMKLRLFKKYKVTKDKPFNGIFYFESGDIE